MHLGFYIQLFFATKFINFLIQKIFSWDTYFNCQIHTEENLDNLPIWSICLSVKIWQAKKFTHVVPFNSILTKLTLLSFIIIKIEYVKYYIKAIYYILTKSDASHDNFFLFFPIWF